jgi:hypothetical protein
MRKMIKVFINALLYAICVIQNVVSEPGVKGLKPSSLLRLPFRL